MVQIASREDDEGFEVVTVMPRQPSSGLTTLSPRGQKMNETSLWTLTQSGEDDNNSEEPTSPHIDLPSWKRRRRITTLPVCNRWRCRRPARPTL